MEYFVVSCDRNCRNKKGFKMNGRFPKMLFWQEAVELFSINLIQWNIVNVYSRDTCYNLYGKL